MDFKKAFEIVIDLASQNVIDEEEMPDEYNTQMVAVNIVDEFKKFFFEADPTMEILNNPKAMKMLQQSIADIRVGLLHDHDDVEKEFG